MKGLVNRLLACVAIVLCASCSKNEDPYKNVIWDVNPVVVYVDIQDGYGNSLLAPEVDGSVVGEEMSVVFEEKEYSLQWTTEWVRPSLVSRAYLAVFKGLHYDKYDDDYLDPVFGLPVGTSRYYISIGELPGDKDYDKSMELNYDGKTYVIRVVNHFEYRKDKPVIDTSIYVDDELLDRPLLVIKSAE